MKRQSEAFMFGDKIQRESVGEGLTRQLLGYNDLGPNAKIYPGQELKITP